MAIAENIKSSLASSSMIRKMFEEGMQLKKQHGADKVFDFSLGNPDVEPPKAFHDLLVEIANKDEKGSHGYMPNAGYPFVREALAKKVCKEQNVNVDGTHIVMASGAAGGLNAVFKTICNAGDEVIVSRPYFMEYRAYTANHGAKLIEVDSKDNFDLDLEKIKSALNEKTAAVIINSPNNPTGKIYGAQDLDALSSILNEHGKKTGRYPYLVSDEPYREIAYECTVPPVLSCYKESIVVSSYSKSLSLPGERIGFIAVNPQISDKDDLVNGIIYATRILGFVNAPALMQRLVAGLTEETVDVSVYAKRKDAFTKVLDEAGIEYAPPQGAFYLFCKVPGNGDDKMFVEHLKKHLILGVPGTGFGKPGWLRFAYCIDEKIIASSKEAFKQAMASL
ncbi:MAG: pyridoxal phosphate-dependent aminotransferase [Treponema sp.]|nr:pyridoxal phosphate-dependent aminotransferase [Treponema sp.]MCL2238153.1 pyridoxal phosphate-dependent aminotransferase [Treponema sp.]